MYRIVPVASGEQQASGGAGGSPLKKKLAHEGRPLVMAVLLGGVLVLAAVISWCYYSASLRKAQLLKAELLDLNKDGFIIRNQEGAVIFTMTFRWDCLLHITDYCRGKSPHITFSHGQW